MVNLSPILSMQTNLPDGLYRVTTKYLCAGFVVKDHQIIECAPILKAKLYYWTTIAKRVESDGG